MQADAFASETRFVGVRMRFDNKTNDPPKKRQFQLIRLSLVILCLTQFKITYETINRRDCRSDFQFHYGKLVGDEKGRTI